MEKVGILITHGTDTLAWTHAFVRYSIKNNHANIVLTGSQIPMPSLGEFSDAYENLENGMRFLTSMVPPNIITVFNYGKEAFSDSLRKIHRWDNVAFVGDVIAKMEWDEIKYHDKSLEICEPVPMNKLYLITTGGTIESEYNEEGILVPGENHVLGYLTRRFSNYFKELSQNPVFVIDSSDVTFDRMLKISRMVADCLSETNTDAYADLDFERKVKILYTDPLKSKKDYVRECENINGVIIAGYGGGNVTVDASIEENLIPVIESLIASDIPVVLSSQVPMGAADFIYENGHKPIVIGAISGVDLSLPECQIRLSYILGHTDEIKLHGKNRDMNSRQMIDRLFTAGMKFRTQRSKREYERLKGFFTLPEDILINVPFEKSLESLC